MKNYLKRLFSGRISRRNYLFGSFAVLLPYGIIGATLESIKAPEIVYVPFVIIGLVATYTWLISIFVRRLHDINWGGTTVLLGFVPFVNFILSIILIFVPPKDEKNNFGIYKDRGLSLKQIFGLI